MPKTKQTPKIETRLPTESHIRFDELSRARNKTKTELAREALLLYLDHEDKLIADSRETLLEKRMRKMEERIAALQARTAIDVGVIYHLIYDNMNKETRQETIAWAYHSSVERLKQRLEGPAKEIKEKMQKANDQVDSQA